VALAVLCLVSIGMAWNATSRARDAEQALSTQSTQSKTLQQDEAQLTVRLAQAEQTNAQMQGELNLVGNKLKLTQTQVAAARNQVKKERDDYSKKFTDVENTLAGKASADDVKAIGTDVNGVKSDLDATKGNLQSLRGEHGELIARNHEELEQLKRMGERDYYEFTLNGKGQKQHVGNMQVELRGASAKKHQFTVALYVDDMRLEKKNKAVNEPIYFYTNGSHQPMELVVNKVNDKSITGYLSVPKAMAASARMTNN
jgi:chromosome segregation ATPase